MRDVELSGAGLTWVNILFTGWLHLRANALMMTRHGTGLVLVCSPVSLL